jgi:hypothetical protein
VQTLISIRRFRARREVAAARRAADAELLSSRIPSPRFAWRTNELCAPEHRRILSESLVSLVHSAEGRYLPGASPLNRPAARSESPLLLRLAASLAEDSRAVTPRGVLLVERLLSNGDSPLYDRTRAEALHDALTEALDVLEGRR